jgi:phosphoribosyl-AMP cyclohydrolase / phosphoribosyl-ATP pyrophosphohydrolase
MQVDFSKNGDGLVPAIIQDGDTMRVLMLGFMNAEALRRTENTRKVTFYSRSRQKLWIKGETSGNTLFVENILIDCDSDTLLIKVRRPEGPACHTGADTCFSGNDTRSDFLFVLERLIAKRRASPVENSYTSELFRSGLNRIAQKVGEEAVELVIEAKEANNDRLISEAADLLYHILVLLVEKNFRLQDVIDELEARYSGS